jgi:hypothetical protein
MTSRKVVLMLICFLYHYFFIDFLWINILFIEINFFYFLFSRKEDSCSALVEQVAAVIAGKSTWPLVVGKQARLFVCFSVCLSVCLSVLSFDLFDSSYISYVCFYCGCWFVLMSVCPYVYLSMCLFVLLSLCVFTRLSVSPIKTIGKSSISTFSIWS